MRPSRQGPLAQSVEQLTFNQLVEGSNPSRPTININQLFEFAKVLVCSVLPMCNRVTRFTPNSGSLPSLPARILIPLRPALRT